MSALLQIFLGLVLRAPDWLLLRLSGKPQQVRGERRLLPAFQLLCSLLDRAGAPIETLSPPEARDFQDNSPIDFDPLPRDCPPTRDHQVVVDGGEITIREYAPADAPGLLPGLVYFHGGGWVLGNLESHQGLCTRLASLAGCRVFSVDYRLAPEHAFPVPLQDCEAAFEWVLENAAELQVDPHRLAAGGDSAGGNLTAALCISRKESGRTLPCAQLLIYPATDFVFATASYEECATGFFLTRALMEWFRGHYLPSEAEWENPLASPLRAPDLSGHPPAIVATAGFDPLCDEGEAYARRLGEAGVSVERRAYDALIHGFANMGAVREARLAVKELAGLLARRLG